MDFFSFELDRVIAIKLKHSSALLLNWAFFEPAKLEFPWVPSSLRKIAGARIWNLGDGSGELEPEPHSLQTEIWAGAFKSGRWPDPALFSQLVLILIHV